MIFPSYTPIVVAVICIAPLVVGVLLFKIVQSSRQWVRVPPRVFAVLLCLCGVCLLALDGFMSFYFSSTEHSSAIYSPDHQKSIRIETWDAGAVGGGTSVVLYSHFGLIQKSVFSGEYHQTDKDSVRWLNNSSIVISYGGSYSATPVSPFCQGSGSISVKCNPVTFTYPRVISN